MASGRLKKFLQKLLLMPREQDVTLLLWRISILRCVLLATMVLGFLTVIPHTLFPLPNRSLVLLADAITLTLTGFITFYPGIRYKTRAWLFLIVVYLFWVWLSFLVQGLSVIFLIGVPLLATVLLGLKSGLITLVFSMLSLFGLGITFYAEFQVAPDLELSPIQTWLLMLINYAFVAGLLTFACGILIGRLEVALELSHETLRSLNTQREALDQQNQHLRHEIALRELAEAEAQRLALAVAQARTDCYLRCNRDHHLYQSGLQRGVWNPSAGEPVTGIGGGG